MILYSEKGIFTLL